MRITTKVVSSIPPRWGVLDTTLCDNVCQRQVGAFLQFRPPINVIRQFLLLLRRVSLVEQELLTLMEHMSSPPVFSGVRVDWSLVLCLMFCRSFFVLFLLAIVLSVRWFTDLDNPFGIYKLCFVVSLVQIDWCLFLTDYYYLRDN